MVYMFYKLHKPPFNWFVQWNRKCWTIGLRYQVEIMKVLTIQYCTATENVEKELDYQIKVNSVILIRKT